MKKIVLLWVLIVTIASCASNNSEQNTLRRWMQQDGKLKVLCTTAMIADIVQGVGGDKIDCLTLIQGASDPHSYQLVKGDDEKLSRADVIFYNGLGLEHGPSLRAALEGSPKAVGLGDYVKKVRSSDIVHVDSTVDPHIWMDIGLWKETIPCILQTLEKALEQGSFANKSFLENNAKALSVKLQSLDNEIRECMNAIPLQDRYLVTTHDAFNYFTRAYLCPKEELSTAFWRLRCMAPEGLAPDSQLSTADIQQLTDHLEHFNIQVLFAESNISQDSLKKLIDAMGKKGRSVRLASRALYADAMGQEGSDATTYSGMMRHNSQVIARELTSRPSALNVDK